MFIQTASHRTRRWRRKNQVINKLEPKLSSDRPAILEQWLDSVGSLLFSSAEPKKSGNWPVLFMARLTAAQKRPPSPRDVLALKRKSSKRADSQLVHQRPPLVFQSVKKSIRALKDTKNFHFFFAAASILSTPPSFDHWKAKPKPWTKRGENVTKKKFFLEHSLVAENEKRTFYSPRNEFRLKMGDYCWEDKF
jgi:hypothetical protein